MSPFVHATTVSAGLVARRFGIVASVAVVEHVWSTSTLILKSRSCMGKLRSADAPIWLSLIFVLAVVVLEGLLEAISGVAVERSIICVRHLVV